jgi:hypothetical protein
MHKRKRKHEARKAEDRTQNERKGAVRGRAELSHMPALARLYLLSGFLAQAVALLYYLAKLALSAESCILCRTPFPGILALLVLVKQFFWVKHTGTWVPGPRQRSSNILRIGEDDKSRAGG